MFSLIVSIISIALLVVLAAASMYYGGDALTSGRNSADAAAFVTGAQQISGAQVMHLSLEGALANDIDALVTTGFLASKPVVKTGEVGWFLDNTPSARQVSASVATAEVCSQINKSAGAPKGEGSVPYTITNEELADLAYGCVGNNFYFKY